MDNSIHFVLLALDLLHRTKQTPDVLKVIEYLENALKSDPLKDRPQLKEMTKHLNEYD